MQLNDTLYPKISFNDSYLLSGVIVVSPSKRFVIDQFLGFGVNNLRIALVILEINRNRRVG